MAFPTGGRVFYRFMLRLAPKLAASLFLGVCLYASGCAAPLGLVRITGFDPQDLNRLDTIEDMTALSRHTIRLRSAINETVSFCVAIDNLHASIESPRLSIGPIESLAGRLDVSAFEIFRLHSVRQPPLPGWHIRLIPPNERVTTPMDVLVPIDAPLGGLPRQLEPAHAYYFWVDVTIAKATNDGVYTTSLDLYSGSQRVASEPIELTVLPLVLPDESDVMFLGELDHRTLFRHSVGTTSTLFALGTDDWRYNAHRDELNDTLVYTLRLLESHGVTPILHKLAPIARMNARDGLSLDWSQYDAVVEPIMEGRIFPNHIGVGVWPIPPVPQAERLIASTHRHDTVERTQRLVRSYLAMCASHFAKKGWLTRNYWIPPTASPMMQDGLDQLGVMAAIAQRVNPGLRIVSRGCPQDLTPYGWSGAARPAPDSPIDIWMPSARFYDPTAMAEQRSRNRHTWISHDDPPYVGTTHISAPSSYVRSLGWTLTSLDAEAIDLGCVNDWPDASGSPTPGTCVAYDPYVLLYPGRAFGLRHPVPSVRLKRLRRAAQDVAFRRLLRERNLDHVAQTLESTLVTYAGSAAYRSHYADGRDIGWVDDLAQYDRARRIMIDAILASTNGNSTAKAFKTTTDWKRLMSDSRSVRLGVDGCNVRYTGTGRDWQSEIVCTITLTNHMRTPAAGRLRYTNTPLGWDEPNEGKQVPEIPPNGSRRVVLTATSTGFPLQTGGFLDLPVEWLMEDGRLAETKARVSFATVIPFDGPIAIDGDLSDWPPGSVNMLGDFRLITGGPIDESDDRATHPLARTIGFVMQDDDYLYVAVNTTLNDRELGLQQRRNTLRYDGMTPIGEPLVEVLVDPLNSGTRSPADLYHLVIKPSGAHLSERGVGLDPPVGARTAWAADVQVATRLSRGQWMTELRVPWTSFDDAIRQNSVWGLNVTRYDALTQQYSTWSGAVGNAYDPMSLGNVFIPAIPDQR